MNLIKKAGNYLRFGLNIFFLLTVSVFLFPSCSNLLDKNESYDIGFKNGYLKGYSEAIIKKEKEAAEPAEGKKKSQVEEYLDFYNGEGVQHVAIATADIVATVTELQKRGIEFLNIPESYYETVLDRVGKIDEDLEPLQKLGVLIDRDDEGYLLQIFSKPLEDRPTLFFEIIQRKGAQSFGKGNFKALFESIEEEQRKRGTL